MDKRNTGSEGNARERGHPALDEGGDALVPSGGARSNQLPMQGHVKNLLDGKISRRQFGKTLAALGFSAVAAESLVRMISEADAQTLPRARGKSVEGTGAEILVEALLAAGVEYLFATTATGMTAIFDALTLRPQMKFVLTLQEGQATAMAHGYELASGKTAALLVPGVAIPSAMNNLYNAWKDRSAIVAISDAQQTNFMGRNQFQQMDDWLEPLQQFTKWRWQINRPERLSEFTRRAIKMAGTPPGGPVHLRIPNNILGAPKLKQTVYPQELFRVDVNLPPRPELIEAAAQALLEAKSPYINVGHEVTRSGAVGDVVRLAELLGARVSQGYSVYGDFPFKHPLWAGFYGLGGPKHLARSDAFLNLGTEMPSPGILAPTPPRKATVIHARTEYEDIGNFQPTDIAIAGGVREITTALIDAIEGMATAQRLAKLREPRMAAAEQDFAERLADQRKAAEDDWDASPMSWARMAFELDQNLAEDAIIVSELDNRLPYHWMDFAPGKKRLIGQTTGFALGWGVGAALGVKVARPDHQVVCLVGDGAFLFGQTEALWVAARHDIPITIVVFNNESYDGERERIYWFSPLARNKNTREQWKDISCYLGDPLVDFAGVSRAFGVDAETVTEPGRMQGALKRARQANRDGSAYLIDARIMQQGHGANSTWHPDISIAGNRKRKI